VTYLRQMMLEELRRQDYAPGTIRSYTCRLQLAASRSMPSRFIRMHFRGSTLNELLETGRAPSLPKAASHVKRHGCEIHYECVVRKLN